MNNNLHRSIYHFDPTNLPKCSKLQITPASPTSVTSSAPSPTLSSNEAAHNRKKFKPKPNTVREMYDDDGGGGDDADPKIICDNADASSDMAGNASNPEIEITHLPCDGSDIIGTTSDTTIVMNTLLAPLNQIHSENFSNSGAENESDGNNFLMVAFAIAQIF